MEDETYQLIYTSRATEFLTLDQLKEIDQKSKFYNLLHDITGLLLYAEGRFASSLQGRFLGVLEGPFEEIEKLVRIVQKNEHHFNMVVLYMGQEEKRNFTDWKLGYMKKKEETPILDNFFDVDRLFEENKRLHGPFHPTFDYFRSPGNSMSGS